MFVVLFSCTDLCALLPSLVPGISMSKIAMFNHLISAPAFVCKNKLHFCICFVREGELQTFYLSIAHLKILWNVTKIEECQVNINKIKRCSYPRKVWSNYVWFLLFVVTIWWNCLMSELTPRIQKGAICKWKKKTQRTTQVHMLKG